MLYGIFESVNMGSTRYAERIFDCVSTKDVENGMFGYLGELADGYDHIYNFVAGAPAGNEAIVVVDQPAWNEDECRISNQRRDKFFIPAGTPFRVRVVKPGDEFGVNILAIAEAGRDTVEKTEDFVASKVFLTIGTDGKLVAKTEATPDAPMEARIMRKRTMGGTLVTDARSYGYSYVLYEAKVKSMSTRGTVEF